MGNHFINDTPKPAATVEPSPGSKQIMLGVDRFDGRQATVPVFVWTYKQYIDSAANTNGDGVHEKELWVESRGGRGERESLTRMVPDQLFMVGPSLKCETSSQVKTTLISSEAAASNFQKSQYSVGYDNDQTVEVQGEANGVKAGIKKEIKNNMKYGASEETRSYSKAAKSGRTRSVFATVRATSFKAVLTDDKSLSKYFVQAVKDLSTSACTSKKATAAIIAGQSSLDAAAAIKATNEVCDTLLREFIGKFGTDYITSAVLGGTVSQQLSIGSESTTDITDQKLTEASSKSFNAFNVKFAQSASKQKNEVLKKVQEKGAQLATATFKGGSPQSDSLAWCDSISSAPVVIAYTDESISKLLKANSRGQLSEISEAKLDTLQKHLDQFLEVVLPAKYDQCENGQTYDKSADTCVGIEGCPPGSELGDPSSGKSSLIKHTANTFGDDAVPKTSTTQCEKCDAGKYSPGGTPIAGGTCKSCEEGTIAAQAGATKCTPCDGGFTSDEARTSCIKGGMWKMVSTGGGRIYYDRSKKWQAGCVLSEAPPGASDYVNNQAETGAYWDCTNKANTIELVPVIGSNPDKPKYKVKSKQRGTAKFLFLYKYWYKGFKYWGVWSTTQSTEFDVDTDSASPPYPLNELTYTDAAGKKYYTVMTAYTSSSFVSALSCQSWEYCPLLCFYDPTEYPKYKYGRNPDGTYKNGKWYTATSGESSEGRLDPVPK